MSNIIHQIENEEIKGNLDNPSFILTNKIGGFLFLSNQKISRHQGFFFHDGTDLFKSVENIYPEGDENIDKVTNKICCVNRNRGLHLDETFYVPSGSNTLIYTLCERRNIIIEMDSKRNHDNREFGRYYNIYEKDDRIIIEFTRNDGQKDEYRVFTVINKSNYEKIENFKKTYYSYDHLRSSPPYDWYIFEAIKIFSDTLVITSHTNLDLAIKEHDYMMDEWKRQLENDMSMKIDAPDIKNEKIKCAYGLSRNSIFSLIQTINDKKGIYAGIPWFYQFWTRDELISLKSLMIMRKYDAVKNILMRQLNSIQDDGRLPNRYPQSQLASADGICWFHKRIADFTEHLESRNLLYHIFMKQEIVHIKQAMGISVEKLMKNYAKDGLPANKMDETWMDTDYNKKDIRDGFRVEIAALYLSMVNSYHKICAIADDKIEEKKAKNIEDMMHANARKAFWNGKYLNDGSQDKTIRPNIFIAYYVYPQLLSKDEWISCFDNALKALFLDWGGITTIQKNSPLFTDTHTGEDNKSYHCGDSWFWLNNLAAICMIDLSKRKYSKYINKIIEASTQEILFSGAIGHHAEVSSAKELSSFGCFAQSWSAAMYVELVEKNGY